MEDALIGAPCPECGHIVVCYPLFGIVKHYECALKAAEKRAVQKAQDARDTKRLLGLIVE